MEKKFKNIIVLLFITTMVKAQVVSPDTTQQLPGMKIVLKGTGNVTVNYGKKIGDDPLFKDSAKIETEVKYEFLDKKAPSNFKVKTIKAPKLRMSEPLVKINKRYAAFGVNDFRTAPMAKLSYSTIRNRNYSAGFDMSHFSQQQATGGASDALYGNSEVSLYGKKFFEGKLLYGAANYENNTLNFFGFNNDQFLQISEKQLERGVGRYHVTGGVKSNLKDETKWGYHVNLDYKALSLDNMATVEHKVDFNGSANKYMEWKKYAWFKGVFHMDYSASYLNSGRPGLDHESVLFNLFPSFDLKLDQMDLKVGAKTFYQTDNKKLNAMAYAEADFSFVKDVLHIFARFQNDFQRLSYLDYIYENPFVANNQNILNVSTPIDFMGGFKGAFSANSSFSLGLRYRDFASMPLYYNLESNPLRQFEIITDRVENQQIFAEFLHEGKKLNLLARGEYNTYNVYENEAYQLPEIYMETRLSYKLKDKFVLGTDLFYYGEQLGLKSFDSDNRPQTIKIDPIFDFNIDFRYNYSDKMGAFLKTNNILNTKHQRWDQYSNFGFNMLVGVDYNF
ncbi:MAG: hypothetical protein CMP61_03920 [Flavobacteriales bacterium]|nr:hypothetical protein [Flavobacteriales bacterium]|tara:strand:- start:11558 stop:13243 length:1686 start_codon:yes stop_codon:yes gene_type:complete